jgi:hypothetical protein
MAEQDFNYEEQQGNVLGGEQSQAELLSSAGRRGGSPSRFPDRALDLKGQQGSGPASTTGRRYERMVDTAGKVNQLQHGVTGPQATSGQAARDQLMTARQTRQDSYRDSLGYKGDYGLTLSDASYAKAEDQRKGFEKHVAGTKSAISAERGRISAESSRVASQAATANAQLNAQKSGALGSLPSAMGYKSLSRAYSDWTRTWSTIKVYSRNSGSRPEAVLRIPSEVKSGWISAVGAPGTGWEAAGNIVYVGSRGAELYRNYNNTISRSKTEFYNNAGPQIANYNRDVDSFNSQINRDRSTINQQFVNATNTLNKQISDANATLGRRSGAVRGAEQGISREITARTEYLGEIRQSYTDRLARIDEALSSSVGRGDASNSEAKQVRQIDPRMPGAQAQAQAA